MRIHVTTFGKVTTVSVDEVLAAYLLAKVGDDAIEKYGFESKKAKKQLTAWIQEKLDDPACKVPANGLSQWVRRLMLNEIVSNDIRGRYFRTKDVHARLLETKQQNRANFDKTRAGAGK